MATYWSLGGWELHHFLGLKCPIGFQVLLHPNMVPVTNLTRAARERRKPINTLRGWDWAEKNPGWRNRSTQEARHVYCIELNREAGLLNTAEPGVGLIVYSWMEEAGLDNLSRHSLSGAVFRL